VNSNVHETLASTMHQDTETTRKPLSTFEENTVEALKTQCL